MKVPFSSCRSFAVLVGAVAVGWWLAGWWPAPDRAETTHRDDGPSKPGRMLTVGKGPLEAEFAAVAAAGDAGAQMAAAVALAARIDPKDFAAFLENLRHLPAHAAQGLASRTVLRRWVALDPAAALRWCATNDRDLVDGVLDEWAQNTPPEKVARLLDEIPAAHRAQAIPSIFNALAAQDPGAAMDFLALPGADKSLHRINHTLAQLAHRDSVWLLERAESLPDQVRQNVRKAVVQAMVETDTSDGFAWVMAQPDRTTLLRSLAEKPSNVPGWVAAVAGLPHSEQSEMQMYFLNLKGGESAAFVDAIVAHRGELSNSLLNYLLSSAGHAMTRTDDPGSLANRLLALDLGQGFLVSEFAAIWSNRSPEEARAWAASLANETQRRAAIDAIDRATAPPTDAAPPSLADKLIVQAGDISGFHEPHLLLALTEEQRLQVLQTGFDRAASITAPELQRLDGWRTLSSRYPAEAARWLADTVTAENAAKLMNPLAATAAHWAAENPQAAATWAATLPPGEPRAWAAANIVGQWRLLNESAARAWIETLPPDEHAIIAKGLGGSAPAR